MIETIIRSSNKDPKAIFEFSWLKILLSQIKGSNFFTNSLSDITMRKYQNTVLL